MGRSVTVTTSEKSLIDYCRVGCMGGQWWGGGCEGSREIVLVTALNSTYVFSNTAYFNSNTCLIHYSKFATDHYLRQYYIFRHGYHTKTKNGMYSRTCLFPEFHCCLPNVNNR